MGFSVAVGTGVAEGVGAAVTEDVASAIGSAVADVPPAQAATTTIASTSAAIRITEPFMGSSCTPRDSRSVPPPRTTPGPRTSGRFAISWPQRCLGRDAWSQTTCWGLAQQGDQGRAPHTNEYPAGRHLVMSPHATKTVDT